ncbi:uncharacterized protein conserved in bacteria [Halothermothrix orenii H 168]|uniref:Uncharacterized protein conserved in bacteria n=2 Tax=Halothermothrix orenii TaxID=31909 RepID=B8CVZ8_HALOH|nr:uncharacterized protein conserved in bacteria [Halothermothrix orenii H 168]
MGKITFPHMGNLNIIAKTFFQEMGIEVVVPPGNSKKTLDLGVKYSPEFACLPLKINMGNFIESFEKGADTVVMGGGCGPCRFGYYGEVQREILKDLGYDFNMIVLEPDIFQGLKSLRKLFGKINIGKIYRAGKLAWVKLKAVDNIQNMVLKNRAREKNPGDIDRLYQDFLDKIDETMSIDSIVKTENKYRTMIEDAVGEYKRGMEIKIGIVGEIYVVIEPFTNLEIEKKLGSLGAVVEREITIRNWVIDFVGFSSERQKIEDAARPYLKNFVGGHGLDTVGNTVRFARAGYDGVVQVAPFTCMPEVVAQTILPVVSKKEKISVMSLFLDEHTGDAGFKTRLEAFIDLIERKKNNKGVLQHG